MTRRVRGILGEEPPFLTCSKATKLRVFDAILKTGATLYGAFAVGSYEDRFSSMILSVEVDEDKLQSLQDLAKATLSPHDDIQIGFDIHKSVKEIVYG